MSAPRGRRREKRSHIKDLARSVLESEENSNDIVDLLEYLEAEDEVVLKSAIRAVGRVCCHLVKENYSWLLPSGSLQAHTDSDPRPPSPPLEASGVADITRRYRDWMRGNCCACVDGLLQLVRQKDKDVQVASLTSLMKLVEAEGSAHQAMHHSYCFPNALFCRVTMAMLDGGKNTRHLVDLFQEYLLFDDVRYHWLRNITTIISSKTNTKRQSREKQHLSPSPQFVENVHHALRGLVMPKEEEELARFFAGDPPLLPAAQGRGGEEGLEAGEEGEKEGEEGEGTVGPPRAKRRRTTSERRALSVRRLQGHRKHFSDAWLAFLRLPLSSATFKAVLVDLHSAVMPHLLDPRLLIDFLVDCYDTGGVVSILALNGLFILIHEHHLNYPDFFLKLYALLEPSIFHVKYMQRFFYLVDTFLRSSHLPLYLVAAFAKKIARLSLTAPPNGVMVAAVFVTNLTRRHPNCRVLLHRKNTEEVELRSDPFDMEEPDPAKCRALESCLWELKTHEYHYLPAVSSLVKRLLRPGPVGKVEQQRREESLGKYLDTDLAAMFEEDCSGTLSSDDEVPLNFVEPTSLWEVLDSLVQVESLETHDS